MADQSNLTINQQLAGLIIGEPRNITAQHMRDVVLSIDTKINAGSSGDLKADGTVTLTDNWDAGAFRILLESIQARSGQTLTLRDANARAVIELANGGALTLNPNTNIILTKDTRLNNDRKLFFGSSDNAAMIWDTAQTNPHLILGVDTTTYIYVVTGLDRIGTVDFAIGVQSTPTVFFHDGSTTPGNFGSITHDGTDLLITSNAGSISIAANLIPDGNDTRTFGGTGAAWNTIFVNDIQPGGASAIFLRTEGGAVALQISTGGDVTIFEDLNPDANNSNDFGNNTTAWQRGFINNIQPVGGSLILEDDSGNTALTIQDADDVIVGTDFIPSNNILTDNGAPGSAWRNVFTDVLRAPTGINMKIRRADGTTMINYTTTLATITGETTVQDNVKFDHGSGADFQWVYETVNQTNNTLILGTQGSEGNTVVFTDKARLTLDHAVGTPSTPTWRWHDGSATATNFGSITHDGTDLVLSTNAGDLKLAPAGNITVTAGKTITLLGTISPNGDAGGDLGLASAAWGTAFVRIIRADLGSNLQILDNGGGQSAIFQTTQTVFNEVGANKDHRFEGDNDTVLLTTDAGLDRVGIGIALAGHLGKLHVDQVSLTGAIPTLYLDQADLSEEFIEFAAVIGTGNPIEAVAAKAMTPSHFIRVDVAGVGHLYLEVGPIA